MCFCILLLAAPHAQAQDAKVQFGGHPAKQNQELELPEGIEELARIESSRALVWHDADSHDAESHGFAADALTAQQPIQSLTSIEAQMILLVETATGFKRYVPQHISPNAFARLFGSVIVPTQEFVASGQSIQR